MQRATLIGQGGLNNHMANLVSHNSGNSDLMGNAYSGMGAINMKTGEYLQHANIGNNLDMNGINQNVVVHIGALNNMQGFNPSMNSMNSMGQAS